jgi:predicted RNA binding protein YcfA (HicA-like mRNA interferase family)
LQVSLGLTVCGSGGIESQPMPRKIRQLVSDLAKAGFLPVTGGKGSHRKFRHPRFPGSVILSGADGDDAHHYQEKQVRNAIREATK